MKDSYHCPKCGYILPKKEAIIVIGLVEESSEKQNEEIEKEILEELSKHPPTISWLKKVKKIIVPEIAFFTF